MLCLSSGKFFLLFFFYSFILGVFSYIEISMRTYIYKQSSGKFKAQKYLIRVRQRSLN